jgi:hypothetical protein
MARLLSLPVGEDEGDESVVLQGEHPPGELGQSRTPYRTSVAVGLTGKSFCR